VRVCIIPAAILSRVCIKMLPWLPAPKRASRRVMRAAVTLNLISYTIKSIICFPAQLAASCAPGNYFARALTTPSVDQVAGAENREPLHFGGGSVKVRLFWNVRRRYEKDEQIELLRRRSTKN
jgi:hypothetical protein